jgi:stage IV sporulation protein FB
MLDRIPEDWRDESAIAVAGPIASVAVALTSFLAAAAAGHPLLPASLLEGPLLVRLGWVNLLLAVFNLLPAFPLDGGRVLRAQLERNRSRVAATAQAARVSRLLAGGMIFVGLLTNLWLVLIGLFVIVAGRAEEAAVLVHATLGPTAAGAAAQPCPVGFDTDLAAADALGIAERHPQPAYPVTDRDGAHRGLVTRGRLERAAPDEPVGSLASTVSVDAATSLEEAAALVASGPVAVVGGGRVVGVVTAEMLERRVRQRIGELDG